MDKNMVRFVVSLAISAGKFDVFEKTMKEMVAGTEGEPGTLEYNWYLSADRSKCRLVENYVDANAMLSHMMSPVVQVLVPKLLESGSLTAFEVYGDPGVKGERGVGGVGSGVFWGVEGSGEVRRFGSFLVPRLRRSGIIFWTGYPGLPTWAYVWLRARPGLRVEPPSLSAPELLLCRALSQTRPGLGLAASAGSAGETRVFLKGNCLNASGGSLVRGTRIGGASAKCKPGSGDLGIEGPTQFRSAISAALNRYSR